MRWLEKFTNQIYALLRIMAGFMFSFHGVQKILGAAQTNCAHPCHSGFFIDKPLVQDAIGEYSSLLNVTFALLALLIKQTGAECLG